MAFGSSITALLDTYSNCISLLRAFRHRGDEASSRGSNAVDKQVCLRKSLRSDRELVEREYLSRVSESGNRFKKGDARAISSLDRILKRLKGAIANLLRLSSTKQGPDLDYESLMSLSNASRIEAIKAIDSLSRRLGSPSRSSLVSSSSKSSSKASSKASSSSSSSSRRKRRASSGASRLPPSKLSKEHRQPERSSTKKAPPTPRHESGKVPPVSKQSKSSSASTTPKSSSHKTSSLKPSSSIPSSPKPAETKTVPHHPRPTSTSSKLSGTTQEAPDTSKPQANSHLRPESTSPTPSDTKLQPQSHLRPVSTSPKPATNRYSMMSFASDSTKLGEIPQRKWRSVHVSVEESDDHADEYNVRPTFPLKPYTVEVKQRRFLGIFGRKKEAT